MFVCFFLIIILFLFLFFFFFVYKKINLGNNGGSIGGADLVLRLGNGALAVNMMSTFKLVFLKIIIIIILIKRLKTNDC